MKTKTTNENLVNNSNQPQQEELKEIKSEKTLPYGINQPTTVEEFRKNLRKYYVIVRDCLYLKGYSSIPLNRISSFDDIYKLTKTGSNGNGDSPSISPKIRFKKDFSEFMIETNQIFTFNDYFLNEDNYEIIENQNEFMRTGYPKWFSLDNQITREFYWLTLGDYSGYTMNIS